MAWVRPTSHTANGWTDPANAYDGNTGTTADNTTPRNNWTDYLEMYLNEIECSEIRVYTSRQNLQVTTVEFDIRYNGNWTNVYSGEPTDEGGAVTTTIDPAETVDGIRVRFYGTQTRTCHIHDTELYEVVSSTPGSANLTTSETVQAITAGFSNLTTSETVRASNSNNLTATEFVTEPSDIPTSGLVLHLDADAIEGLNDNDTVETWSDLSGEENDFAQATGANQPTYKTNILNGKPVVRFDGNDYLNGNSLINAADPRPITIIVVARTSTTTKTIQSIFTNNTSSSGPTLYVDLEQVSGATYRMRLYSGAYDASADTFTLDTDAHQYMWTWATNNAVDYFRNGNSKGSGSRSLSGTGTGASIGAIQNLVASGFTFDGDIAEILVYNRVLSTAEREEVEQYLGVKWLGWVDDVETATLATSETVRASNSSNLGTTESVTEPSDIPTSGLVLHLDADAIEGLSDNDTVATWSDLSGEGNDATASGGPTYKTDVLNGKPVVRFDGQDDYFTTQSNIDCTAAYTMFVVAKNRIRKDWNGIFGLNADISNTDSVHEWYWQGPVGSSKSGHLVIAGDRGGTGFFWQTADNVGPEPGNFYQSTIRGEDNEGVNLQWWVDQTELFVDRSGGSPILPKSAATGIIGRGYQPGYLDGDIAEIIIYDRALTTEEREQVEQYLGGKWLGWAPATETATLATSETIRASNKATLNATERVEEVGSATLTTTETVQGTGAANLAVSETIQGLGFASLTANESIQGVGAASLGTTELVQGLGSAQLTTAETIQGLGFASLATSETVNVTGEVTLATTELIQGTGLSTLTASETIEDLVEGAAYLGTNEIIRGIGAANLNATEFTQVTGLATLGITEAVTGVGSANLGTTENVTAGQASNLAISETIQGAGSNTLTLNETIQGMGLANLSVTEQVQGAGTSALSVSETVQGTGQVNLAASEAVQGTGSSVLAITESVQGLSSSSLGTAETVQGLGTANLPSNESIQGVGASSLSVDEFIQVTGASTLNTTEEIQGLGSSSLSATELVNDTATDIITTWAEYRKQGDMGWTATSVQEIETSGDRFANISGLDHRSTYEFRGVAERDGTIYYGDTLTFETDTQFYYAYLATAETVRVTATSSLPVNEDVEVTGAATLNTAETVQGAGSSTLTTSESIQVTGLDTLTASETVQGLADFSLSATETVQGLNVSVLSATEVVVLSEAGIENLLVSETIQVLGLEVLPTTERVAILITDELPTTENIVVVAHLPTEEEVRVLGLGTLLVTELVSVVGVDILPSTSTVRGYNIITLLATEIIRHISETAHLSCYETVLTKVWIETIVLRGNLCMNKFDYQNFIMFTGDSANIYVTVYDCDGEVVPLTDCSIDWICDIDDNTVISKATDDGSITVDLVKQEFVVHLTPEDTENLSATSYPHKAIIVDYEGNRSTILKGFASFK